MTRAYVEELLYAALLEEVQATPKPGLVDRHDSGAHRDMDIHTFAASAAAITPHLGRMFAEGRRWRASPPALFQAIRPLGREAERAMLAATGGVNTHKGAIFTLGILAAAAGLEQQRSGKLASGRILEAGQEMTAGILREELARLAGRTPLTHGERIYADTGAAGIRGEAMAGFPALRDVALPTLAGSRQPDWNAQLLETLLRLMTSLSDTTILHRAGPAGLAWVQDQAGAFLAARPVLDASALRELSGMNRAFTARNISPGGSADLLAAAVFLLALEGN